MYEHENELARYSTEIAIVFIKEVIRCLENVNPPFFYEITRIIYVLLLPPDC